MPTRELPRSTPIPASPLRRVLVAEDDQEFRELLVQALRRDHHLVTEAHDGADLLDKIVSGLLEHHRHPDFDLIVSDVRMPGFDGLELLGGMRSAGLSIPVILITAFADAQTRLVASEHGAALLDKPFELVDLRFLVNATLAERGQRPAARAARPTHA